ncbi:MAG TPA: methionyl-tRNA formyltransferase [Firmicutes bacterium]|nr:methionyl-tRNA formyltransferase [Bacillota bacterium]
MRVVFMGTPDFAVPILRAVAEAGHEILAVVTQPDRPGGRGMKLLPSPVKSEALQKGYQVLQPEKLDRETIAALSRMAPEVITVAAFGQLLPEELLRVPKYGCLNVHPSLLPRHRGATPIQQALLDGDVITGVTIMVMEKALDAGPIMLQKQSVIMSSDDAGSLGEHLSAAGGALLVEALQLLAAGQAVCRRQDDSAATYCRKLKKEDALLDWNLPAEKLARQVRAFNPHPGAYCFRGKERLKIRRAGLASGLMWDAAPAQAQGPVQVQAPAQVPDGACRPGQIVAVENEALRVACGAGELLLFEVQPAGRPLMSGAAYARGRRLAPGDLLLP